MSRADADAAWAATGGQPGVLEGFVSFEREFSILLARSVDGQVVIWDAPDNEHKSGILDRSTVPAGPLIRAQAAEAGALAREVAEALDYVGVLPLEVFASETGQVVHEMAPHAPNSGPW